jgi:serine phosphatase RsbU (regulator of sigma subunit)
MPRDLRDWSPSLLKIVAEATAIPEVIVLHDPSPEELEACALDGRLAVLAIVPGRPEARAAALRAGALEALDPDLPEVEIRARVETAIARFRAKKTHEDARTTLDKQATQLRRDLLLASRLQRSFLPRQLPVLEGYEFAAAYYPRDLVSGDTYDVRFLDGDHLGIYTADAMGHGIRGALVSTALRSRYRPVVHEGEKVAIRPPHVVLAELDQSLRDADLAESPTAAMCYGVLDLPGRKLAVANAGHPLPVRLRVSGETDLIGKSCLLLGVVPEEYVTVEVDLAPGDRVFFATDGCEPDYGGRLVAELVARRGLSLDDQVHGALGAVLVLDAEGQREDDCTLLAFEVKETKGT